MKVTKPVLFASLLGVALGVQGQGMSSDTGKPSAPATSSSRGATQSNQSSQGAAISNNEFATKAAQTGLAEVEIGKLAQKRASDPAVKQYADELVTAHTDANDQLKTIARNENIKLPKNLSAQDKKDRDELAQLRGAQFDKKFLEVQTKAHEKAIDLFQREAEQGSGEMQSFAQNTLPHLQDHLAKAQSLQNGGKTSRR